MTVFQPRWITTLGTSTTVELFKRMRKFVTMSGWKRIKTILSLPCSGLGTIITNLSIPRSAWYRIRKNFTGEIIGRYFMIRKIMLLDVAVFLVCMFAWGLIVVKIRFTAEDRPRRGSLRDYVCDGPRRKIARRIAAAQAQQSPSSQRGSGREFEYGFLTRS